MDHRSPTPLLNDLYQFTMAQGHVDAGIADRTAVFDLLYRRAPFGGAFAVASGIEEAIDFVSGFAFTPSDLAFLDSLDLFTSDLLDRLADLRFSGAVSAVPEGTVIFPRESFLRVTAPLLEAQLLETPLLNMIGFSTLSATKGLRIRIAAGDAEVFEFGCRRGQRADGALAASRGAYLAGCSGTSNLEAARIWQIPTRGTMAHSWVLAFGDERRAFRAYAHRFPDTSIFLIDTHDTLQSGLPAAIDVALEMRSDGHELLGVRLDSGDLLSLSLECRARLDEAGLPDVRIVASGDLDENSIASLVKHDAPIDVYGVGTSIAACKGEPSLSIVYKLAAIEEDDSGTLAARCKHSDEPGKSTLPGLKELYRFRTSDGRHMADLIALSSESPDAWSSPTKPDSAGEWTRILELCVEDGRRCRPLENLSTCRERVKTQVEALPEVVTRLDDAGAYPVDFSPGLEDLMKATLHQNG